MAKRQTVNVWEVLQWECPVCCESNEGESWLQRGDEVICEACQTVHVVEDHYADCRPSALSDGPRLLEKPKLKRKAVKR